MWERLVRALSQGFFFLKQYTQQWYTDARPHRLNDSIPARCWCCDGGDDETILHILRCPSRREALYGFIKSALLWYELFTGELRDVGFKLNPYDKCVANKMIDGKQCTIAWWVEDDCLSHLSTKVLDRIIEWIKLKFDKMAVTRGDKHTFLGIKFRFPGDGSVRINMRGHFCYQNKHFKYISHHGDLRSF